MQYALIFSFDQNNLTFSSQYEDMNHKTTCTFRTKNMKTKTKIAPSFSNAVRF